MDDCRALPKGFLLMAEPCDQCLTTKNRIVPAARCREIVAKCKRDDGYFICHKASMRGVEVACRGVHNTTGYCQMARISGRLGMLHEVTPADVEALPISTADDEEDDQP